MSTFKKISVISLFILLLAFFVPATLMHFYYGNPLSIFGYNIHFGPLQPYLFWFSLTLLILLLFGILVVLFWPNTKQDFFLKKGEHKLVVKKEALEGLVRSSLEKEKMITHPKVKIRATKQTIDIYVKGYLNQTISTLDQSQYWVEKVQNEVQQYLDKKEDVKVTLHFTQYKKKKKTNQPPRVK